MQGRSNRSTGYPRGASTSQALRALEPRIGQSPRDEKGRSSLDRQTPEHVGGVKGALLEKIGQDGVDAIFAVATTRPKQRRRGRKPVAA